MFVFLALAFQQQQLRKMRGMSECGGELDSQELRKKWLTRLANEYEKVVRVMPAHFLEGGVEYPRWVERIERELSLVLLPGAKLKAPDTAVMTARRMGALIGHSCAIMVWVLSDPKVQELYALLAPWYNAARRLAKLSLCSCVDQTYEDMRDFLVGYADGFSRKPKTLKVGELGNTTFEIYLFMLLYWRSVQGMRSVRGLHESLVKIFGANRVGEEKRIEKICQRIGLTFRKAGRPKKE
jgi:hypothetical protein